MTTWCLRAVQTPTRLSVHGARSVPIPRHRYCGQTEAEKKIHWKNFLLSFSLAVFFISFSLLSFYYFLSFFLSSRSCPFSPLPWPKFSYRLSDYYKLPVLTASDSCCQCIFMYFKLSTCKTLVDNKVHEIFLRSKKRELTENTRDSCKIVQKLGLSVIVHHPSSVIVVTVSVWRLLRLTAAAKRRLFISSERYWFYSDRSFVISAIHLWLGYTYSTAALCIHRYEMLVWVCSKFATMKWPFKIPSHSKRLFTPHCEI